MTSKPNPLFLKATLRAHWGYIVRQIGASAAQLSYLLPPPSTIVGAFANPLARMLSHEDGGLPYTLSSSRAKRHGLPQGSRVMECAVRATITAGAYIASSDVGVSSYGEASRIIGAAYKGGGSYQKAVKKPIYQGITELMPVQAVGASIAPNTTLNIAWVLDPDELSACLGTKVNEDSLLKAAWHIYRLGSKEGIVSTEHAEVGRPHTLPPGSRFETYYYQSALCVKPLENTARITLPLPWAVEETFYSPSSPGSGPAIMYTTSQPKKFVLRDGCWGYKVSEHEVIASLSKKVVP